MHLQCMLFLPEAIKKTETAMNNNSNSIEFLPEAHVNNDLQSMQMISALELRLFGGTTTTVEKKSGTKKVRYRLLREAVKDMVHVKWHNVFKVCVYANKKHNLPTHFVQQHCIQLNDCCTELDHSVWEWLYNVVVVLQDRTHKLCEDRRMMANVKQEFKSTTKGGREKKEIRPTTMMPTLFAEK